MSVEYRKNQQPVNETDIITQRDIMIKLLMMMPSVSSVVKRQGECQQCIMVNIHTINIVVERFAWRNVCLINNS